jgi:hypothetical protein
MDVPVPFEEFVPGDRSSYDVDGDMSALANTFVQLNTSRPRTVQAWTSGLSVGMLVNAPVQTATSTRFSLSAIVQLRGKALVKTGAGGLAVGDLVKPAAGGVGVKATPTAGDVIVGQCEVAAAEGLNATVRLIGPFYYAIT